MAPASLAPLARWVAGQRSARARKAARGALAATALAGAVAASGASPRVWASDHLDGPRTTADPQADIADVFAFTSPEDASHLVLAMTVTPFAAADASFSSEVDYAFRVRRVLATQPLTLDSTPLDVVCDAAGGPPQTMTCAAGALSSTAVFGDTGGSAPAGSPMRVFAGLRSDPAFFDRQGALATVAGGRYAFTGTNQFAGANVLAIVVDVDVSALVAASDAGTTGAGFAGVIDAGAPMLAVAAETNRRGR